MQKYNIRRAIRDVAICLGVLYSINAATQLGKYLSLSMNEKAIPSLKAEYHLLLKSVHRVKESGHDDDTDLKSLNELERKIEINLSELDEIPKEKELARQRILNPLAGRL